MWKYFLFFCWAEASPDCISLGRKTRKTQGFIIPVCFIYILVYFWIYFFKAFHNSSCLEWVTKQTRLFSISVQCKLGETRALKCSFLNVIFSLSRNEKRKGLLEIRKFKFIFSSKGFFPPSCRHSRKQIICSVEELKCQFFCYVQFTSLAKCDAMLKLLAALTLSHACWVYIICNLAIVVYGFSNLSLSDLKRSVMSNCFFMSLVHKTSFSLSKHLSPPS